MSCSLRVDWWTSKRLSRSASEKQRDGNEGNEGRTLKVDVDPPKNELNMLLELLVLMVESVEVAETGLSLF